MKKIVFAAILLLICSSAAFGQRTKIVHYILDEYYTDTQFIEQLDSLIREYDQFYEKDKGRYCSVWIIPRENNEYWVSATLPLDFNPPDPSKYHFGYIEYNGMIYILARENPDNMFVRKPCGNQKVFTTKVYRDGEILGIEDPPNMWFIMGDDKILRDR